MTGAAWAMLGVTWSVIVFFTVRFFRKVLQNPTPPDSGDDSNVRAVRLPRPGRPWCWTMRPRSIG